jgi:hypothetical protein
LYVVNDENERKECIIAGPLFEIARGETLDPETEQLYNRASSPANSESDAAQRKAKVEGRCKVSHPHVYVWDDLGHFSV